MEGGNKDRNSKIINEPLQCQKRLQINPSVLEGYRIKVLVHGPCNFVGGKAISDV